MSDTPATPSDNRYRFRAWQKREQKMWHDVCVGGFPGTIASVWDETYSDGPQWVSLAGNQDEYILMQSTGLTDKNGILIFEGDIVRGKETGVVEWFPQDGAWGVRVDSEAWSYLFTCNLPEKHEVIGNIYENPDLLPKP